MAEVVDFPATSTLTVEQALGVAANRNLKEVLIVGYDEDANLIIVSSKMDRRDALWLAEKAKLNALGQL